MRKYSLLHILIPALLLFLTIFASLCTTTPILQEEVNYLKKAEYYEGLKDYEDSVCWYRKAADQGNVDGQAGMGFMCGKWLGSGTEPWRSGKVV